MSLAPLLVSITLPGFRSRWTMPLRCALSSASAISIADRSASSAASGLRAEAMRERLALEVLHDEVVDVVLRADVVEHADVADAESGDRLGLALEALRAFPDGRSGAREEP